MIEIALLFKIMDDYDRSGDITVDGSHTDLGLSCTFNSPISINETQLEEDSAINKSSVNNTLVIDEIPQKGKNGIMLKSIDQKINKFGTDGCGHDTSVSLSSKESRENKEQFKSLKKEVKDALASGNEPNIEKVLKLISEADSELWNSEYEQKVQIQSKEPLLIDSPQNVYVEENKKISCSDEKSFFESEFTNRIKIVKKEVIEIHLKESQQITEKYDRLISQYEEMKKKELQKSLENRKNKEALIELIEKENEVYSVSSHINNI